MPREDACRNRDRQNKKRAGSKANLREIGHDLAVNRLDERQ
jgi:hypothetical protein